MRARVLGVLLLAAVVGVVRRRPRLPAPAAWADARSAADDYSRTEDSVRFVFRDGNNRLRYNYFQWFAGPDSSEASLEMSVAGRKADASGLDALFATFASSLRPTDE